MGHIYAIDDTRTMYIKARMQAHNGAWNAVTRVWMFATGADAANAMCELYRATRASIAMRETLLAMIADGTATIAWNYDPLTPAIDVDTVDFAHAQQLLAAGYAARRVLGIHRLDDEPVADRGEITDEERNAAFDDRARAKASAARNRAFTR